MKGPIFDKLKILLDDALKSPESLCNVCEKLELGRFIVNEVNEIAIGSIGDYNRIQDCSFCALISKAISLAWGINGSSGGVHHSPLNTAHRLFMQSRSPLVLKVNGQMKYPAPRILLAIDQQPPSHQDNRPTLREIDRSENRFIFAEIEQLLDDSDDFIRRRAVPKSLNTPLLQKWLFNCENHQHSKALIQRRTKSLLFNRETPFRLVDVVQECLTLQVEWCKYIALSYTWGKSATILNSNKKSKEAPILVTTQRNVAGLHRPHALSSTQRGKPRHGIVPRTICDAMELARRLGIRYLWVDTLCIVQDDQQERSRQISLMGNIYNNSTLTIAAAAGKNPHAGLYGISPRAGRPIEKYRIKDPDESMFLTLSLCLPSLCQEVRKSKWYTRGWTYQEQCLSQRCIYFTTDEIFFQCPEVQWREGYDYGEQLVPFQDLRIRTGPPWWSKRLRKDPDPTPYHYLWDVTMRQQAESYQRAVREYTRRSLTSPHDVLHAFEGIFNRFNRQENASDLDIRRTQGIPVHLLLQAILWFPSNSCQRRLCNDKQITGVVEQFSTWSWASWDGPIEFIFAESLWLSRSISHAPRRNVPLHVCIPWWQFGDSMRKVWTNSSWKAVGENHHKSPGHFPDDFLHSQQYLSDHIGVDIVQLVNHSITLHQSMPRCGQLRFVAPYFGSGKFVLSGAVDKSIRVVTLCGVYCGEFQFDG